MCQYCENEKKKYPDEKYEPICPRKAGLFTGRVIKKVLLGEDLTGNESALFDAFCKLANPTFYNVPLTEIKSMGGIITTRFGKPDNQ